MVLRGYDKVVAAIKGVVVAAIKEVDTGNVVAAGDRGRHGRSWAPWGAKSNPLREL